MIIYLLKIKNILNEKKNSIAKNLEIKNWKKVQENFEDAFRNKSEDFKSQLKLNFKESTKNIKIYYDAQCYDILDKFYSEKCQREYNLFKDYNFISLGGYNNIEETIQQIFDDIITGSKSVSEWNRIKNLFNWAYSKISYLTKTVDFIINKISNSNKLKKFKNDIKELIYKYKNNLNNEIKSSKDRVVVELEIKKEIEQI